MSPHRRLELVKHLQQQGAWLAAAAAYAELAELVPSDHRFLANQANALWLADLPGLALVCLWSHVLLDGVDGPLARHQHTAPSRSKSNGRQARVGSSDRRDKPSKLWNFAISTG